MAIGGGGHLNAAGWLGYIGQHAANFLKGEGGMEGVGKELALLWITVLGVGLHQRIEVLMGGRADQIPHKEQPAGAQYPQHFCEGWPWIWQVMNKAIADDYGKGTVGKGQCLGIAGAKGDVRALLSMGVGDRQYSCAQIRGGDVPMGVSLREHPGNSCCACADIQQR